jgi:hypothetical protein
MSILLMLGLSLGWYNRHNPSNMDDFMVVLIAPPLQNANTALDQVTRTLERVFQSQAQHLYTRSVNISLLESLNTVRTSKRPREFILK